MSIGKRIISDFNRIDSKQLNKFSNAASANVSDCMGRLYSMDASIRPYGKTKRIFGQALTIKTAMADNLLFHKALLMAQPGDVIVADASGDLNHSLCGDIMYSYARSKNLGGFVVNGSIRDVDYLDDHEFPVYASGVTGRGPYKTGPGEINVDITCGGQVVHPGDIIIGDEDGIVVLPPEHAEEVYEKLETLVKNEERNKSLIDEGKWENGPLALQVNKILKDEGYEFI